MDKQKIHNLSAQPDDNLQPLEGEELAGEEGSDLELKFTGYDENVAVYSWLAGEDWERFKKELSLYLEKKNLGCDHRAAASGFATGNRGLSEVSLSGCRLSDRILGYTPHQSSL